MTTANIKKGIAQIRDMVNWFARFNVNFGGDASVEEWAITLISEGAVEHNFVPRLSRVNPGYRYDDVEKEVNRSRS